jgi:hypothetical protein
MDPPWCIQHRPATRTPNPRYWAAFHGRETKLGPEHPDTIESLQQLASDTRPGADGRPRPKTFSSQKTRTHGAVRMAISRAIGAIGAVDSSLADHFTDHIDHRNGGHRYTPASPSRIDWDLG